MTSMRRVAGVVLAVGLMLPALPGAQAAPQPPAVPPDLALDRPLPVDAAVRTGRFENGLRFFIRQNGRPAGRVSLRLAVDAGSLQETDDQRGLAHFLEHMAFNGTEHFKPGELIGFLESIGARFGPHVNASTSFDETIYMLDVPTDRDGYVDRGLLALRDFAAGILLLPAEVDKERGVVLEEWRGRLGASSRLTDQQLPVLLRGSRYADRLPIGTPEIIQNAPVERLRAFYETWYRPDQMAVVVVGDVAPAEAEALVRRHFAALARPAGTVPSVDRTVPDHAETLYSLATDPEAQGWTVTLSFKGAAPAQATVADYRASLVRQLIGEMLAPRLSEIARRPNAPFVGADGGVGTFGRTLQMFELGAAVPEQAGRRPEALVVEARRMERFGFSEAELARARALLAFTSGPTTSGRPRRARRWRPSTSATSRRTSRFRHRLRYRLASTYLPTVTADEVSAMARGLVTEGNRVVLAVAPEKKEGPAPSVESLREAMRAATPPSSSPGATPPRAERSSRTRRRAVGSPRRVASRTRRDRAHALERGRGVAKPTDFKSDQVVFSAYARGGRRRAEETFHEAERPALAAVGGFGGLSPVDLGKLLSAASRRRPPDWRHTQEVSGRRRPAISRPPCSSTTWPSRRRT